VHYSHISDTVSGRDALQRKPRAPEREEPYRTVEAVHPLRRALV
jgi:hypothetical protein